MKQRELGAPLSAPTRPERVYRDSGLTAGQQEARAALARMWAARVLALVEIAGADVRLALRSIEEADREERGTPGQTGAPATTEGKRA